MNTWPPFPTPPFTSLATNSNPNPSFFQTLPLNHTYHSIPTTTPPSDVQNTLSALKDLINLSETAISSSFVPHHVDDGLCPCPFNCHHRVPAESLFRHFLSCPSSHSVIDPDIVKSTNYPNTVRSKAELSKQNPFVQTLRESDGELCFSIDDCCDFGINFFYKDCPGVVSSSDQDRTARVFTLPKYLSVECANFEANDGRYAKGCKKDRLKLLPSEYWAVRSEIEAWNDYPNVYSHVVLKAILSSNMVKECDLLRWVISNSPSYGLVIDVAMRDHIFVLFKLCLKAITTEASHLADSSLDERHLEFPSKSFNVKCTVLVEVLKWLTSQLSILYGEVYGKVFCIAMFKQCLFSSALGSLYFPFEQKVTESPLLREVSQNLDVTAEEPTENGAENRMQSEQDELNNSEDIVVSQVAAAVAALHERSYLEEKIKALRVSQTPNRYQLLSEHAYVAKRADEVRKKRPNYRQVIEHDGLIWQSSQNQETSNTKTREELLAEERDYKRRRMSYRGKKLKRSTTEVMRDIIDEYMEEIKQAGGIGCFVKGSGNVHEYKNDAFHSSSGHKRQSYPDYDSSASSARLDDVHVKDQRTCVVGERRDRDFYSRDRGKRYRKHSRHHDSGSSASVNKHQSLEGSDERRNRYVNSRSGSTKKNEFEDRYDPFESRD